MTLRDRLRARQLPTQTVLLPPATDGGEPEEITLRGLPAVEWEALIGLHPAAPDDEAKGAGWDVSTFRPALLAASVVTPDGEDPLTERDWAELTASGSMTAGEINLLYNAAVLLNSRAPAVSTGKDSRGMPS